MIRISGFTGTSTLFGVLMAFLVFTGCAHAHPAGHGSGSEPGEKSGKMHRSTHHAQLPARFGGGPVDLDALDRHLELSPEQQGQFKTLRTAYRKEMILLQARQKVAQIELWESIEKSDWNLEMAGLRVREVEAIRAEIMLYRLKSLQDVRDFLTDEQFEKFRKVGFPSMRSGMQAPRSGGMFHPPGAGGGYDRGGGSPGHKFGKGHGKDYD